MYQLITIYIAFTISIYSSRSIGSTGTSKNNIDLQTDFSLVISSYGNSVLELSGVYFDMGIIPFKDVKEDIESSYERSWFRSLGKFPFIALPFAGAPSWSSYGPTYNSRDNKVHTRKAPLTDDQINNYNARNSEVFNYYRRRVSTHSIHYTARKTINNISLAKKSSLALWITIFGNLSEGKSFVPIGRALFPLTDICDFKESNRVKKTFRFVRIDNNKSRIKIESFHGLPYETRDDPTSLFFALSFPDSSRLCEEIAPIPIKKPEKSVPASADI